MSSFEILVEDAPEHTSRALDQDLEITSPLPVPKWDSQLPPKGHELFTIAWFCRGAMVWFVFALFGWASYAYLFLNSFYNNNLAVSIVEGIFFVVLMFMMSFSYLACIFTDPGTVPKNFISSVNHADGEETFEKNFKGDLRFCNKCGHPKPDRCHHCSVCNRCILKMDHHCPWINNCVGWRNYKAFLLFLFYTLVECAYVVATVSPTFFTVIHSKIDGNSAQIMILAIVAGFFFVMLFFFFIMHIRYLLRNVTTIEDMEKATQFKKLLLNKRRRNLDLESGRRDVGEDADPNSLTDPYQLSDSMQNIVQVFGHRPILWLIPLPTNKGDGCHFPVKN